MTGVFGWASSVAFSLGGETIRWSDLIGNLCGLATVGLAVRRHILTWPVQIVGCVLLFGASVSVHLGGNAARQVVLATMASYGWWSWVRGRRGSAGSVPVRFARPVERIALIAALALGTAGFAWLLSVTHSSWSPIPDAYIFIGSVVATFAQARGFVEFWVVWLAVDLVGVPLVWTHGLVVSGLVYAVYFVIVLFGLRNWWRRSRQPEINPVSTPAPVG